MNTAYHDMAGTDVEYYLAAVELTEAINSYLILHEYDKDTKEDKKRVVEARRRYGQLRRRI